SALDGDEGSRQADLRANPWECMDGMELGNRASAIERDVGDQSNRERVYRAIVGKPGISTSALATTLGLCVPTIVYHLGKLENERLVTRERSGRTTACFHGGFPPQVKAAIRALTEPATVAVARQILQHPFMSTADRARAIGITPQAVNRQIRKLQREGQLRRVGQLGGTRGLVLTREAERLLAGPFDPGEPATAHVPRGARD